MRTTNRFGALRTIVSGLALAAWLAAPALAQTQPDKPYGPLGKVHAAEGYKCNKCHTSGKLEAKIPQETCLSCHGDGDSRKLAASTAKIKPVNPHENRHYGTEADCGLCHRVHEKSVNFCADCHPRYELKVK